MSAAEQRDADPALLRRGLEREQPRRLRRARDRRLRRPPGHARAPARPRGLQDAERDVPHGVPRRLGDVDQIVAEDDKVGCRWTSSGTHEGDLFGIPPTGKKVAVTATVFYRVEDGRLAEGWINRDDFGLMRQLGVIPMPE